jgi:nitrogen fixation NifU-like protein
VTSEFDEIQELNLEDARKIYSETTINHFMNPRNLGDMRDAAGFAKVTGSCGDNMEIWLKVRNGAIAEATFMTDGCGTSIASGSMVTELVKGRNVGEARRISQQDILGALGGLPEESEHYALLAADTLKEAIKDYMMMEREYIGNVTMENKSAASTGE